MKNLLIGVFWIYLLVGTVSWVFGDTVHTKDTEKLIVVLYVFNDKTEMWDRAREETVKNIPCNKLRGVFSTDYDIGIR